MAAAIDERELCTKDRLEASHSRSLFKTHRPIHRIVIGESQRRHVNFNRALDQLFRCGYAIEE